MQRAGQNPPLPRPDSVKQVALSNCEKQMALSGVFGLVPGEHIVLNTCTGVGYFLLYVATFPELLLSLCKYLLRK
jgi:hypothetical protein